MERAHPTENFHLGFDACHSLQLSTDRFFRVNGKQPLFPLEVCEFWSVTRARSPPIKKRIWVGWYNSKLWKQGNLSPIYTAENFRHGSDKSGTRTQKNNTD